MTVYSDRYSRQRMIQGWDQDRLQQARVLVAGVGALGNEVLKSLVLLGVGHLLLIDLDRVEWSNLSRTVLFKETDIGRPKVEAAADALTCLNPEVTIQAIDGDIFYAVGLAYYRHSHLAIGCLDNLAARSQMGLSCSLAGIPYLDGGMWSLGGEVRWFASGDGPCFDCTLGPDDWRRATERRSCTGFRSPEMEQSQLVPTLATTSSIIGGLLAQEAVKWLCGYPVAMGKAIVYNGQALTLHRTELVRNPGCPSSHVPYSSVVELPHRAADLTPRQLLAIAQADLEHRGLQVLTRDAASAGSLDSELRLELGRDFLLALQCTKCGHRQEINHLWSQVPESARVCPRCAAICHAEVIRSVAEGSPYVDRTLAVLGVPPGEVLAIRTPSGLRLYELTGDLSSM